MYLCFVGETSTREDTFILSINPTPVEGFLAGLMQGMGEILSDALLVSTELHLIAQYLTLILLSDMALLPHIASADLSETGAHFSFHSRSRQVQISTHLSFSLIYYHSTDCRGDCNDWPLLLPPER